VYLETIRLILRPHDQTDFEDYFEYIMNPELQNMLGLHDADDRSSAQATFRWLLDNLEFIALVSKESGKAIGHICIHPPYERVSDFPEFKGKKGASLSFAIENRSRGRV